MNSAFLLIAFGFGFKIFAESSERQKKSLKQFGRIVGIGMMAVSLCGILCTIASCISGKGCGMTSSAYCPLPGHQNEIMGQNYRSMKSDKKFCPIMSESMGDGPTAVAGKKEK